MFWRKIKKIHKSAGTIRNECWVSNLKGYQLHDQPYKQCSVAQTCCCLCRRGHYACFSTFHHLYNRFPESRIIKIHISRRSSRIVRVIPRHAPYTPWLIHTNRYGHRYQKCWFARAGLSQACLWIDLRKSNLSLHAEAKNKCTYHVWKSTCLEVWRKNRLDSNIYM